MNLSDVILQYTLMDIVLYVPIFLGSLAMLIYGTLQIINQNEKLINQNKQLSEELDNLKQNQKKTPLV